MSARLEAMNRTFNAKGGLDPSARTTVRRHVREFRKELKVSSQIGYILFRIASI
jgi:hypothetical protein